jgi:hypothetical protein
MVTPGIPLALRTRSVHFHFLLEPFPDRRSNSVGLMKVPLSVSTAIFRQSKVPVLVPQMMLT